LFTPKIGGGSIVTAFNAVRFRVKAGRDQEFIGAYKKMAGDWPGLRRLNIIKTAEHSYCAIAEWNDMTRWPRRART
jgi:hypothetical protein